MGEARVILCTNAISGKGEVCLKFAIGCKVWVFQDEAQFMTASDPMGLNSSSLDSEMTKKVVMQFLSGDLKQLPPFTTSRTGRYNTVNEFVPQRNFGLFKRKTGSAFPVINLVEQRRAAEILTRGANMFHFPWAGLCNNHDHR